MPQLVKGGKHVFGWSKVSKAGRIVIPPDAFVEYGFSECRNAILMSGSKKSGGFGLTTLNLLKDSPLSEFLKSAPEIAEYRIHEGEAIEVNSKTYCWVKIIDKSISVPLATLQKYDIRAGEPLLTVRGSGIALGFIVRGPIIEEAARHPELAIFG